MTSIIRKLEREELGDFWEIIATSFPGVQFSREGKANRVKWFNTILDNYKEFGYYGLFKEKKLQGGTAIIDLKLQLLSQEIVSRGTGMVAVDLLHKKEKVCMEMIKYFLKESVKKNINMTVLYPFRTDFYKQMGFGYGSRVHQYRLKPESFPKGITKEHLTYIEKEELQSLLDCFNEFHHKTNGSIAKTWFGIAGIFTPETRVIAYKKDGKLEGYLIFHFERVQPKYEGMVDMIIDEFIFNSREALSEFCTFLNCQGDQVNRIIIRTEDENFHMLFNNPSNGFNDSSNTDYIETNVSGVGVMYRVVNVKGIFGELSNHNFNGQDCKLKITVKDNFLPENDGSTIIHFNRGAARAAANDEYEVEISLDISEFSSLLVGAVDFKWLYNYGLADISDKAYMEIVNKIFYSENKPMCYTHF